MRFHLVKSTGLVHYGERLYTKEDNMSTMTDRISMQIASAIKRRREQLGLTLRMLAARSGISPSMISDIERGAKSPTVSTLAALAPALGVAVSALLDSDASVTGRIHLVRASERAEHVDAASGARRYDLGSAQGGSKVDFTRFVVPPHVIAGPFAAHARGTIEHVFIAAGTIRVEFGDDAVILEAGDSCSSLADAPHYFDNREGDVEALMYIVAEKP
jgi:transcriptional regulator with XRE-family HTH domain